MIANQGIWSGNWKIVKQAMGSGMIHVTERAMQELKRILARDEGKLGLGIDIEAPEDRAIEYEGTKVLIVESGLDTNLKGITLDVDDTPDGVELVLSEMS